jgi:hypothetical protein
MRNLNVAIAIGVSPSFNAILTTTNELPQKIIKVSIRSALNAPMALVVMLLNCRGLCIKDLADETSWKVNDKYPNQNYFFI